ncbi:MAG: ABC transporter permease subunit [Eubacteriales bacterium]
MSVQNENKKKKAGVFKTLGRWIRRMFMGGSKELAEGDIFAAEKLESTTRLAVQGFLRRKLAVAALIVLICLFLLVFIGPLFLPMDLAFTDANQKNIAPNITMRSVPSALKSQIADINGFSCFSVGVSEDHNLYIWGYSKDALSGDNYADFPEEIQKGNVLMAAAGSNHVIAITTDGKVVGWGNNSRGQYGYSTGNPDDPIQEMPVEFIEGKIEDTSKISQLVCGYQVTALVLDGRVYMWGNTNACLNMKDVVSGSEEGLYTNVKKVALSNYYALLLMEDGTIVMPGGAFNREYAVSSVSGSVSMMSYLKDKKVVDIAATNDCFAILLEDGDVLIQGAARYGEDKVVSLPAGEKLISLDSGAAHFAGVSNAGKAYAWGADDKGQCDINGESCAAVYTGAYQTYLVDADGKLVDSCGLKGYLFGTDSLGRDIFTRLIHGGKMTMTIGAVAVIVSSIIAIIIGCVSGYFGGWVDMLLMRITEIFSAIPFLPFAMMLSYVLTSRPISETTRIFIIMVILGLLSWTGLARMIRGQVLAEREKEFVISAKAMGVKESRIAFKHILPNIISVILVSMTLDFAGCLLTESSLSYLGFGVQQPRPTWGNMLNGANNSIVIQNYWWQWLFPAIFLSIATISINIIGDALRDVLDPKSNQEK